MQRLRVSWLSPFTMLSMCCPLWRGVVERATPGQEDMGSFALWPHAPYWLGRCEYNVTGWERSHALAALSRVWQHVKLSDVSLGTRPSHSLVVDEGVKKPIKQRNKQTNYPLWIKNPRSPLEPSCAPVIQLFVGWQKLRAIELNTLCSFFWQV